MRFPVENNDPGGFTEIGNHLHAVVGRHPDVSGPVVLRHAGDDASQGTVVEPYVIIMSRRTVAVIETEQSFAPGSDPHSAGIVLPETGRFADCFDLRIPTGLSGVGIDREEAVFERPGPKLSAAVAIEDPDIGVRRFAIETPEPLRSMFVDGPVDGQKNPALVRDTDVVHF